MSENLSRKALKGQIAPLLFRVLPILFFQPFLSLSIVDNGFNFSIGFLE